MMTTESHRHPVLRGAVVAASGVSIVALIVAVIVDGGQGLVGAVIGAVASVVILGGGTWLVLRAASISPATSLLVALVVFTFQGLLLLGVLGLVAGVTDGHQVRWSAIEVIAVTVAWTSAFAFLVRRERIPLFDLSGSGTS